MPTETRRTAREVIESRIQAEQQRLANLQAARERIAPVDPEYPRDPFDPVDGPPARLARNVRSVQQMQDDALANLDERAREERDRRWREQYFNYARGAGPVAPEPAQRPMPIPDAIPSPDAVDQIVRVYTDTVSGHVTITPSPGQTWQTISGTYNGEPLESMQLGRRTATISLNQDVPFVINGQKVLVGLRAGNGAINVVISTERGSYRKRVITLLVNSIGKLVFFRESLNIREAYHGLQVMQRDDCYIISERKE